MQQEQPYRASTDLTLRDELAIDRTVLANERTLLAYLRTALALVILGATFLHFLQAAIAHVAGWTCVVLGLVTAVLGAVRFQRMRMRLLAIDKKSTSRVGPRAE